MMLIRLGLQAQKFIEAYSAFLKRQGKLPIPGVYILYISHFPLLSSSPGSLADIASLPRLG
jgi:hypothetical protein